MFLPVRISQLVKISSLQFVKSANMSEFRFLQGLLRPCNVMVNSCRTRTRQVNIQRPAPPHWKKARMLKLIEPFFVQPDRQIPLYEACEKISQTSSAAALEPTQYEKVLARDLLNKFNNSKLIAVYHINSTTAEDLSKVRYLLHPHGMRFEQRGKKIARLALSSTPYEPILHLFEAHTGFLFSKEATVHKLFKLDKKMPTFVLLGGFVDGKLLNRDQLLWYSQLPGIDAVRGELCSILGAAASRLSQNLTYHQQTLAQALEQHSRQLEGKKE